MVTTHDHQVIRRTRRHSRIMVELRPTATSTIALRQRERELERLIVLAACRRAIRQANGQNAAVGE